MPSLNDPTPPFINPETGKLYKPEEVPMYMENGKYVINDPELKKMVEDSRKKGKRTAKHS
jgi:hypothetical protein